jgi:hypothetical protein
LSGPLQDRAAQSTGRPLIELPDAVRERAARTPRELEPGEPTDRKLFAALVCRIDAIDCSDRD